MWPETETRCVNMDKNVTTTSEGKIKHVLFIV